jgi:peptidyl-prolyl cis-trans isomerase C
VKLRERAEQLLLEVRCDNSPDRGQPGDLFAQQARRWSNCPSGAQGGELGWLAAADCAPEFAREVLGHAEVGVLPRLVHSRFGLHVVEIQQRQPGQAQPFEAVQAAVRLALRQHSWVTALRQYLQLLAGEAHLEGVVLDSADTPLVQ